MNPPINLTAPFVLGNLTRRPYGGCRVPLLLLALLLCFAFPLITRGLLPPPAPDGGYPGENTAEGQLALSNVNYMSTTGNGAGKTAIGFAALHTTSTANYNTGIGENVLGFNTTGDNNTAVGAAALRGP